MIYVKIITQTIVWMVLPFMSYWTMQIWSVSTEFGILCAIKTLVVFISCVYCTYIIYKDYKDMKIIRNSKMTVSELIQHLSEHDPDMGVYVTTKNEPCNEIVSVDYELYSCHGRHRGVYLEIGESE